jgi:hypothetical protein
MQIYSKGGLSHPSHSWFGLEQQSLKEVFRANGEETEWRQGWKITTSGGS